MPTYQITMSLGFWSDLGQLPSSVFPRVVRAAERMVEDLWTTELHPEKVRQAERGVL